MESGLSLPAGHPFNILKAGFDSHRTLSTDVALALETITERHNPSSRAERFTFGGACEWVMAAACWVAGLRLFPAGHSQNGFDLTEYKNGLQGLWSLKTSAQAKPSGDVFLVNRQSSGQNSTVETYIHPTVFIAPYLPGITYFDPALAPNFAARIRNDEDAVKLSAKIVKQFAEQNPELVIPFSAPANKNIVTEDPNLGIVVNILTSGAYPSLGPAMKKLKSAHDKVMSLRELRDSGLATEEQFLQALKDIDKSL